MRKRVLAVGIVLLLMLCGCQGKPLPGDMEEEVLLSHGREAAAMLAAGQFDEVYGILREDVALSTSVEDIRNLMLEQTSGAGVYKQIESAMVTGQSSQGEDYGVAVIYCDYSKKNVLFRLAFDVNYQLIGMQVKEQ